MNSLAEHAVNTAKIIKPANEAAGTRERERRREEEGQLIHIQEHLEAHHEIEASAEDIQHLQIATGAQNCNAARLGRRCLATAGLAGSRLHLSEKVEVT